MFFRQLISLAAALALIAAVSAHTNKTKKQARPIDNTVINSDQTLGSEIKGDRVVIDKSQLQKVLELEAKKSLGTDKS
jgi:hypothetical protein